MAEQIGGHLAPDGTPGVHVFRQGNGLIFKEAYTRADVEALGNEARMLRAMDGDHAPNFVSEGKLDNGVYWISQRDLGDTEAVNDEEKFRREAALMLWALRSRSIRHGDLTHKGFPDRGGNVIIRDDIPHAIDFQQSHLFDEPNQDKNPLPDAYHVWKWATYTGPPGEPPIKDPVVQDGYRVIRRWAAMRGALGGNVPGGHNALAGRRLLDLGTHMGDMCGMAAADGMITTGVDNNQIRDGLSFAREFWPMDGMEWVESDLFEYVRDYRDTFDVVACLSTWPYVVERHGRPKAEVVLGQIIERSEVLFFETQMLGDGPGPSFLQNSHQVNEMLRDLGGDATKILSLPSGRGPMREVWKVT